MNDRGRGQGVVVGRDDFKSNCRVLVAGVGALGSEMISKLALSGFRYLTIVDMDIISPSNLSRQLFFRQEHVGLGKAQVAAEKVNQQYPQIKCDFRQVKLEELPRAFYLQFNLILCGVDRVETRLWLNGLVCEMGNFIILIEGGTEGWMGHVRLVLPGQTPCLFCTKDLYTFDRKTIPICTIVGRPTLPEHCISWALTIGWLEEEEEEVGRGDVQLDFNAEDEKHMNRLIRLAQMRAKQFDLYLPSEDYIRSTVGQFIPTVISTTSIIAGFCVLIALQLIEDTFEGYNNYWFYNGGSGLVLTLLSLENDPTCPCCSQLFPSSKSNQ